jgi:hypothetical protein
MNIDIEIELSDPYKRWWITLDKTTTNKSVAEAVTATIHRTFLGAGTIRLTVTGAKESTLENFGLGAHYIGETGLGLSWGKEYIGGALPTFPAVIPKYEESYCDITFGPGEQTKTIALTNYDNHKLEYDRVVTVSLSNASTGIICGGASLAYYFLDDHIPAPTYGGKARRNIINVLNPNGDIDRPGETARAISGVSALQPVADYNNAPDLKRISDWLSANGGGVVYIPDGTWDFDSAQLRMSTAAAGLGVTIHGQSKAGTTLRKYLPAGYWQTTISTRYIVQNDYTSNSGVLNAPLSIVNATIDGRNLYPFMQTAVASISSLNGLTWIFDFNNNDLVKTTKTFTFVTGTPANPDTEIEIGADTATTAQNMITTLQRPANGFTGFVITGTSTINFYYGATNYIWRASGTAISGSKLADFSGENGQNIIYDVNVTYYSSKQQGYLENLHLIGGANADGITVARNTDIVLYRITNDAGYRCRGDISFTGAFSSYTMRGCDLLALHIEIANAGKTLAGVTSHYKNLDIARCDIGAYGYYPNKSGTDATSTSITDRVNVFTSWDLTLSNTAGFPYNTPPAFTNSVFQGAVLGRIVYPCTANFTNTHFCCNGVDANNLSAAFKVTAYSTGPSNNVTITLDGCRFSFTASATGSQKVGVAGQATVDRTKNMLIKVINSTWVGAWDICIGNGNDTGQNGRGLCWEVGPNNVYSGTYFAQLYSSDSYTMQWNIYGAGCTWGVTYFLRVLGLTVSSDTHYFNCQDVAISASQNVVDNIAWATWANAKISKARPDAASGIMRTITGSTPVNGTTPGFTSNDTTWPTLPTAYDKVYVSPSEVHVCLDEANKTWHTFP